MALYTTLASLSQTAGSNAADGTVDAPSTIDNQTNLLASFIAQLRDGVGFTGNGRGRLINVQTISASGTYTPSAGTTSIVVEAVGGGGQGSGSASPAAGQVAVGGGGASGSFTKGIFTSGFTPTVSVTIGAGGAGGF